MVLNGEYFDLSGGLTCIASIASCTSCMNIAVSREDSFKLSNQDFKRRSRRSINAIAATLASIQKVEFGY